MVDGDGTPVDTIPLGQVTMPPHPPVPTPPTALRLADGEPAVLVVEPDSWSVVDVDGVKWNGAWNRGDHGRRPAIIQLEHGPRVVDPALGASTILDFGATDVTASFADLRLASEPVGDPAVADVDGDGRDDLVVLTATHVHVFDRDLVPVTGWPVRLLGRFPLDSDVRLDGGLAVFDGDGDGLNEVWITTDAGHLVGIDARGELMDRTPYLWGVDGGASLVVGSVGEEGRALWLADPGGRRAVGLGRTEVTGRLSAYLPTAVTRDGGTSEWLGTAGGPRRLGTVGEAAEVEGTPAVDDAGRMTVYPNPWREGAVRFRFMAERDGDASVTIYNLEGERVDSVDAEVVGGVVSELAWTPGELASGVYLCRIAYPGPDGTEVSVERLAVER